MENKLDKYADLILNCCLQFKPGFPIVISCTKYDEEFVKILEKKAYALGSSKVYKIISDVLKENELLKKISVEEIKNCDYFDRSIIKKVYDEKGSIIFLCSSIPSELNDISKEKTRMMNLVKKSTQEDAIVARSKYDFPWIIAGVSNEPWAKQIFPDDENATIKLWELIFDCCLINEEDPTLSWERKKQKNDIRTELLNQLKLKTLEYKNDLGTNFSIDLPKDIIWMGTKKKTLDGTRELIVNMPTEEVFTSPDRLSANGIIYASKPLFLRGSIIENLVLEVKDGIITKVDAKSGKKIFEDVINESEGMNRLGECALVDYNSPISLTNVLFKNTLFDENASCHLAIGGSFRMLVKDGSDKTPEELTKMGLNQSNNHVDFMIGTKDLSIIGTDFYGNSVPIFVDGNFAEEQIKKHIKERNK